MSTPGGPPPPAPGVDGDGTSFRRKDFKKMVKPEDARQRRSETSIQIRKNKRLEGLRKKRKGGGGTTSGGPDLPSASGGTSAPLTKVPNEVSLDNLPAFCAAAMSEDPVAQFEGTKQIRRLLSKESDPPVLPVLRAGVIGQLGVFLGCMENSALQFEAAWALTNIASTEHTHVVVELGVTPLLIRLLLSSHKDVREQCCWCLGNIAGDGHRFRDMVLGLPGAIDNLVLNIAHPSSLSMLRNATWTLSNYCRGKPQPHPEHTKRILPVLVHLLNSTDAEVLTDTCWALSYLSDGDDTRIQTVVDSGAVPLLVALMGHDSTAVVNPALRAVGNIVTGNDGQTQAVIDGGALHFFVPLMQCSKRNIRKEACWAVSNVAAGLRDQVTALTRVPGLIATVIHLLEKGEWKVRKEAAWAVSNMTITGTEDHIKILVENGCIPPLCELLCVVDTKICLVAMDALDAILKCGESTGQPFADMVEETGGYDELEKLQESKSQEVYAKAHSILQRHFPENQGDVMDAPAVVEDDGGARYDFGSTTTGTTPGGGYSFT